jgi:hypothetical protein
MEPRAIALLLATGRIVVGAGLVVAPRLVTRPWVGGVADTTGGRVLSAGFGARDMAIGAGLARALTTGGPARGWLLAGAFTDAADLTATLAARHSLPRFGVLSAGALAATGVVAGLWAARALDQPVP